MKAPSYSRAIVVGASSGIGAALVEALVARGVRVAALARRDGELQQLAARLQPLCAQSGARLVVRVHDVAHTAEVPALFEELHTQLGGVDLVIYAAALMPKTAPDEYNTEQDLAQLAVNVGGCIAWGNARRACTRPSGMECSWASPRSPVSVVAKAIPSMAPPKPP